MKKQFKKERLEIQLTSHRRSRKGLSQEQVDQLSREREIQLINALAALDGDILAAFWEEIGE